MRQLIPVLIIGLGGCLLFGWAIAYWHDRKSRRDEDSRERTEDQ